MPKKLTQREQAEQELNAKIELRLSLIDLQSVNEALFRNGEISPDWPEGWEWLLLVHDARNMLAEKRTELAALKSRIDQLECSIAVFFRYAETGESWFGKKDEQGRYIAISKEAEPENDSVS